MSVQLKFKVVNKTYTGDLLTDRYREILINTIRSLIVPTIDWINKYVPKRTGQLRDDLIEYIKIHWRTTVDEKTLIDLITKIEYATDIHGIAAHKGTWFEHSGAPAIANYYNHTGRIYLDDPEAFEYWHLIIEDFVREELRKNIMIQTDNLLGG